MVLHASYFVQAVTGESTTGGGGRLTMHAAITFAPMPRPRQEHGVRISWKAANKAVAIFTPPPVLGVVQDRESSLIPHAPMVVAQGRH